MPFTGHDVPDLAGKTALVTGATGLGFETARVLAHAGASVILAGRDDDKGARAVGRIRQLTPKARTRFARLDLASLTSISRFGEQVGDAPIDILINNAGVMAPPARKLTADGFELQLGTNHLGHFALTGTLLRLLLKAAAPRVVSISSGIAAMGRIDFDDFQSERSYVPNTAYMQSKLANLLFARGLQIRSDRGDWNILSVAAHPGHARTDLIENGAGRPTGLKSVLIKVLQAVASHDAASGALPGLMAATAPAVQKLDYFGPMGLLNQKGPPGLVKLPSRAQDDPVAERLWSVSEKLTGVRFAA
ncbi:hypothetical protein AWL63_00620 [Sphingomonas panacis]|uniref:Short-chain dehydrogenase n=1 Tax=Sphingomonas panacis TaxID=1560345 RepID=A0A1B3ZG42_9SPHN|nr:oxidoreductase [Sphingomonas panacis]AOH86391.1 hypothetical protein AWL63_00620 [Sphingomonas panacis]